MDYISRNDVIFKISIKRHYFNLNCQDRGRESYGPNRNVLDRRFSFCYRSRMFIAAKIKPLLLFSTDCSYLLKAGHTQSGVYSVNPDGKGSFNVYCDMHSELKE